MNKQLGANISKLILNIILFSLVHIRRVFEEFRNQHLDSRNLKC